MSAQTWEIGSGELDRAVWSTPGTPGAARQMLSWFPGEEDTGPTEFVAARGLLFIGGTRLWRSDGTRKGTWRVPGAPGGTFELTRVGSVLYFESTAGLWRTTGTRTGT